MLAYEAESPVPAEQVWPLLARPGRWHEWAPAVRGARGLGDEEVEAGHRGTAQILGLIPVPVEVIDKEPGRSWTWRVPRAGVTIGHHVRPRADGTSVIRVDISASAPLEASLALTYGPVVDLLVHHLARTAPGRG